MAENLRSLYQTELVTVRFRHLCVVENLEDRVNCITKNRLIVDELIASEKVVASD